MKHKEEEKIKKFDDWTEYTGAAEGSGRSKKIWLINNETGKIGLFKYNKVNIIQKDNGEKEEKTLYENVSELIATKIAEMLEIKSAYVEVGTYHGKIGCMSYNLLKDNEELLEGINLINLKYPNYNPDKLYDDKKEEYYSLEMILNSIKGYSGLEEQFIKIIFFDYLIGNTDRHQSNWGVIKKDGKIQGIAPIYDNGSSLCSYVQEEKIEEYLGKDKMRFMSLVDTKSRSRIRINKREYKEPTHLEVMKYLKTKDIDTFNENLDNINKNLKLNRIMEILNNIEEISEARKELIKKYILKKIELINNIKLE